jgi:hypothetical protein
MIYEQQNPFEGSPMSKIRIWCDTENLRGEVFIVQSVKEALAIWGTRDSRPGMMVISAPDPTELPKFLEAAGWKK